MSIIKRLREAEARARRYVLPEDPYVELEALVRGTMRSAFHREPTEAEFLTFAEAFLGAARHTLDTNPAGTDTSFEPTDLRPLSDLFEDIRTHPERWMKDTVGEVEARISW